MDPNQDPRRLAAEQHYLHHQHAAAAASSSQQARHDAASHGAHQYGIHPAFYNTHASTSAYPVASSSGEHYASTSAAAGYIPGGSYANSPEVAAFLPSSFATPTDPRLAHVPQGSLTPDAYGNYPSVPPSATTSASASSVSLHVPSGLPGPQAPARRTRHRDVVSCAQCRRRRSRCNRVFPCSECERRGEAAQCDFSGSTVAPTAASRRRNTSDLQAYTARLEAKIREMQAQIDKWTRSADAKSSKTAAAAAAAGTTAGGGASSSSSASSHQHRTRKRPGLSRTSSKPLPPLTSPPPAQPADLESGVHPGRPGHRPFDLAGELADVLVGVPTQQHAAKHPTRYSHALAHELEATLSNLHPLRPQDSADVTLGSALYSGGFLKLPSLSHMLPTEAQARACIDAYHLWLNCWHFLIDGPTFEAEVDAFFAARRDLKPGSDDLGQTDPQWLAVFFAACGLGAGLLVPERATEVGWSTSAEREQASEEWLGAALRSVVGGGIFSTPTLAGVRALCLLTYRRPPDSLETTMWILSVAVTIANRLNLLCEPSAFFTEQQRNARRSLAWCLAEHDWSTGCLYGKSWNILDADYCEIALPGDPPEIDFREPMTFEPTPDDPLLASARIRATLSRIDFRISQDIAYHRQPDVEEAAAIEEDLDHLETQLPTELRHVLDGVSVRPWPTHEDPQISVSGIFTILAFCYTRLRLHRVFASPDRGDSKGPVHHRAKVLRYGQIMLNIYRSGFFDASWTDPYLLVINGAITLGVCMYESGLDVSDDALVRTQVRGFLESLGRVAQPTVLIHRAMTILGTLLERSYRDLEGSSMQRSRSDTLAQVTVTAAAHSTIPSPADSPQSFSAPGSKPSSRGSAAARPYRGRTFSLPASRRDSGQSTSADSSSSSALPLSGSSSLQFSAHHTPEVVPRPMPPPRGAGAVDYPMNWALNPSAFEQSGNSASYPFGQSPDSVPGAGFYSAESYGWRTAAGDDQTPVLSAGVTTGFFDSTYESGQQGHQDGSGSA